MDSDILSPKQIDAIIAKASKDNPHWEADAGNFMGLFYVVAQKQHDHLVENGWVQLDPDQSLPQVTEDARDDRKWCAAFLCGMMEMTKAGFRKVKEV